MITITDEAANKIKELAALESKPARIRMAIQGGGCSGFQYILVFDSEDRDGDTVIVHQDATVVIDNMSALYLNGVTLSWKESLEGSGFDINNPNASSKCGCGHSFQA